MHIYEEEKNANFTWTFTVKARVCNLLGLGLWCLMPHSTLNCFDEFQMILPNNGQLRSKP
jgi:hypothetical protein